MSSTFSECLMYVQFTSCVDGVGYFLIVLFSSFLKTELFKDFKLQEVYEVVAETDAGFLKKTILEHLLTTFNGNS